MHFLWDVYLFIDIFWRIRCELDRSLVLLLHAIEQLLEGSDEHATDLLEARDPLELRVGRTWRLPRIVESQVIEAVRLILEETSGTLRRLEVVEM